MRNRIISMIVILVMILPMFQSIVWAVEESTETKTYEGMEYTIDSNDKITITKYNGNEENLSIPETIDEKIFQDSIRLRKQFQTGLQLQENTVLFSRKNLQFQNA